MTWSNEPVVVDEYDAITVWDDFHAGGFETRFQHPDHDIEIFTHARYYRDLGAAMKYARAFFSDPIVEDLSDDEVTCFYLRRKNSFEEFNTAMLELWRALGFELILDRLSTLLQWGEDEGGDDTG